MRGVPPGKASRGWRRMVGHWGVLVSVLALGGCASGITTPLPDLPDSHVSSSLSPQDRKKAVDDLTRARDTHEQEAEQEIESSR